MGREGHRVGRQLVEALDSVGANLAEGDGRFSDRESLHLFSIAKGSARQASYWLRRVLSRRLLPAEKVCDRLTRLEACMRMLSALAAARRRRLDSVREAAWHYRAGEPLPTDATSGAHDNLTT